MAQPVKKKIIEKHPELENKPFYTLIVDGTNWNTCHLTNYLVARRYATLESA